MTQQTQHNASPTRVQDCRKNAPHDCHIRILTSAIFVASSFCVKPASALACEMAFPTVGATLEGGATSFSRSSLANLAWSVPTWPVLRPAVAICRTEKTENECVSQKPRTSCHNVFNVLFDSLFRSCSLMAPAALARSCAVGTLPPATPVLWGRVLEPMTVTESVWPHCPGLSRVRMDERNRGQLSKQTSCNDRHSTVADAQSSAAATTHPSLTCCIRVLAK